MIELVCAGDETSCSIQHTLKQELKRVSYMNWGDPASTTIEVTHTRHDEDRDGITDGIKNNEFYTIFMVVNVMPKV